MLMVDLVKPDNQNTQFFEKIFIEYEKLESTLAKGENIMKSLAPEYRLKLYQNLLGAIFYYINWNKFKIVFKDSKPDNFMFAKDDAQNYLLKISDYGTLVGNDSPS